MNTEKTPQPPQKPKPVVDVPGYSRKITQALGNYPELKALAARLNTPLGRVGVAVGVACIIGAGAYLNYRANLQEKIFADINTVSHLQQFSLKIDEMYSETHQLPDSLKDIEQRPSANYMRDSYMFDAATLHPLEYKPLDRKSYQLCATFELNSARIASTLPSDVVNPAWDHEPGYRCFVLTVTGKAREDIPGPIDTTVPASPAPELKLPDTDRK
jgi:hypothetical protein